MPERTLELRSWHKHFDTHKRDHVHLQGWVYGHEEFEDGSWVITSRVLRYFPAMSMIETRNSRYLLDGNHNIEWEEYGVEVVE